MELIPTLLFAGLVFGVCFLADLGFKKLFRSKAQHASGLAVRTNKLTGIIGLGLILLGIAALIYSAGKTIMLVCGIITLLAGAGLCAYYLSYGIFYDGESFLVSSLFKKSRSYRFAEIQSQQLYLLTGGGTIIELQMADGSAVQVQSNMDGAYPFLDAAFAAWCAQTGHDPESCEFHDPANSCWFPKTEG